MEHGTQAELDAAKDDATKLPFGKLFRSISQGDGFLTKEVYRGPSDSMDDSGSVWFIQSVGNGYFHSADDLLVIEEEESDIGTKSDIDYARRVGDATALPFGKKFWSLAGDTRHSVVMRKSKGLDDDDSVFFANECGEADYLNVDAIGTIPVKELKTKAPAKVKKVAQEVVQEDEPESVFDSEFRGWEMLVGQVIVSVKQDSINAAYITTLAGETFRVDGEQRHYGIEILNLVKEK